MEWFQAFMTGFSIAVIIVATWLASGGEMKWPGRG